MNHAGPPAALTCQLPEPMGSLKVAPLPARSAFSLYGSQQPGRPRDHRYIHARSRSRVLNRSARGIKNQARAHLGAGRCPPSPERRRSGSGCPALTCLFLSPGTGQPATRTILNDMSIANVRHGRLQGERASLLTRLPGSCTRSSASSRCSRLPGSAALRKSAAAGVSTSATAVRPAGSRRTKSCGLQAGCVGCRNMRQRACWESTCDRLQSGQLLEHCMACNHRSPCMHSCTPSRKLLCTLIGQSHAPMKLGSYLQEGLHPPPGTEL